MANTDSTTDKPKRTRKSPVPANYERIKEGALKLSLTDKVDLHKALSVAIKDEVSSRQKQADEAAKIANGLG